MATEEDDDEGRDWDDLSTSEKLEAIGCSSTDECIELSRELLDTMEQIEDLVKADAETVPDSRLRKLLLPFFKDE